MVNNARPHNKSVDLKVTHENGHDGRKGRVIIEFKQQVNWFGLDADDAVELAKMILSHARAAGASILKS